MIAPERSTDVNSFGIPHLPYTADDFAGDTQEIWMVDTDDRLAGAISVERSAFSLHAGVR